MNRLSIVVALLAWSQLAIADDKKCKALAEKEAKEHAPKTPTVIFFSKPNNKPKLDYIRGNDDTKKTGSVIYYFATRQTPAPTQLGSPVTADTPIEPTAVSNDKKTCDDGLALWVFEPVVPPPVTQPVPPPSSDCVTGLGATRDAFKLAEAYRKPDCTRFVENSVTSIAEEAVQILGKIVVDRASTAAYSLISRKAREWLKCNDDKPLLAETCTVLKNLRLQDLAMAPDQLRASLAKDALSLFARLKEKVSKDKDKKKAKTSDIGPIHVVLAPQGTTTGPCDAADPRCTIQRWLDKTVIPVLARPVSAITGHPAELAIRNLVDKGLEKIETQANKKLCELADRERVLATAAVSFAACKLSQQTECAIMKVVDEFDAKCTTRMPELQRDAARSIAGHFWDAVSLKKDSTTPDESKRLVAALEGSFEVACMYAVDNAAGPYTCELEAKAHDVELTAAEQVAVMRDVLLAAANRDGAALAAAFVRILTRVLPSPENSESKGMRVISTITAYAATYTATDKDSDEAHDRRTALLESLTRDMTNRTDRGGDTIFSFGGSLGAVVGRRYGFKRDELMSTDTTRDTAWWLPVALNLGFAVDHLCEPPKGKDRHHGFHAELGLLDLGQYVAWEEGLDVAEPDLEDAFSPSLTLGYSFGWELPFFVGVTGGFTPAFDFDSENDADKKGSWNIAAKVGVYVPLFDFN